MVREVLLDPIALLVLAGCCWAASGLASHGAGMASAGPVCVASAAIVLLLLATVAIADALLFDLHENLLLRTLPLGEAGFLELRRAELRWWLWPMAALAMSIAGSALGTAGVVAVALTAIGCLDLAPLGAMHLRRTAGPHRRTVLVASGACTVLATALGATQSAGSTGDVLPIALGLLLLVAGRWAGRSRAASFVRLHPPIASQVASRGSRGMGSSWSMLAKALWLPAPLKARLLRDLVLLMRGWDLRGAALLALSPLSCLYLQGSLDVVPSEAALSWRVLQSTALGSAVIAYAVGPGVYVLRNRTMNWERIAPRPGRSAALASLAYGFLFATLHGAMTLGVVAWSHDGRYDHALGSLALPVLALEWSMVHFSALFSLGNGIGQRVSGEVMIVPSLVVVAVALAGVSMLWPWAAPLYFLVTGGMVGQAIHAYERVEVTW
ncbi:MAG TPA: hypothetical protein DIU15_01605 [Deltaproteobacteria bacterium]|nr:hypothetical protein [Deltaproteobacteria bacterium]